MINRLEKIEIKKNSDNMMLNEFITENRNLFQLDCNGITCFFRKFKKHLVQTFSFCGNI